MKAESFSKYIAAPIEVFTTVVILLLGICFLQFIVTEIGFVFTYKDRPGKLSQAEEELWRIPRSRKNFLPDGTIHLLHTAKYSRASRLYTQEQIYDGNDNLVWEGLHKDRPYGYLSWAHSPHQGFTDKRMKEMQMITPGFSRTLEVPVGSQEKTEQVWRYDPGQDLFIGYRLDVGKIGYVGSTGFTDSKSKAKPFGTFKYFVAWCPEDSFSPTLLWQTNARVYEINFEKQQVDVLFESIEEDIKWVRLHMWGCIMTDPVQCPIGTKYRPTIHCLTEDGKHHLLLRQPEQKLTIIVPEDWRSDYVKLTATKQNIFLYYTGSDLRPPDGCSRFSRAWAKWWRESRSKPHKAWVELYRMNNDGGLDLVNRFDWIRPVYPIIEARLRIRSYVTKVSPPLYSLAWYLFWDKLYWLAHQGSGMTQQYATIIMSWQPGSSVLNWALGAAMMGFTFWHGRPRRTSWAKFVFWLVFVGAFNLAGLLTYLALNHTTVIRCSTCGKRRGLERVDCVHCGAELPAPEQRKLDIIFNA